MTNLAKYTVELEAETQRYTANLKKANSKLERFNRNQRKALDQIKAGFQTLAKAAVVGVGAATAGTLALTKNLDRIAKSAKDANVGVETFQAWAFAASQAGLRTTEFEAALGRASRRVGLFATDGSGPAAKSMEQFGIAVRDANGDVRSQESIIRDYVKALEGLGSAQERTAAITALFGDDARKLNLVFGQGTKNLETFEQQAKDLGIVIEAGVLEQAEKLTDQMDILGRVLKAGLAQNMQSIASVLINIGNAAIRALPHIQNFFDIVTQSRRFQVTNDLTAITQKIKIAEAGALQAIAALEQAGEPSSNIDAVRARTAAAVDLLKKEQASLLDQLDALNRPNRDRQAEPTAAPLAAPALVLSKEQTEGLADYNNMLLEIAATAPTMGDAMVKMWMDQADAGEEAANTLIAIARNQADIQEKLQKEQEERTERGKAQFQSLFGDNMVQAANSGFDSILKSWAKTLQQMAAKAISSKIFDLLAGIGGGGAGSFGGFFSGLFGGARAAGGPVSSGKSYLVGEEGPELFTPRSSGNIVPNGAGGSTVINIDAANADAGVIPRIEAAVERAVAIAAQNRLESKRRGR